jgi:integrase
VKTAIALEEQIGLPVKQAGRVTRKSGSRKLYVDFNYNSVRIEKSTGLDDTPVNWQIARQWLDRQTEKIDTGKFVFAEAFPGASEEEKAFHAVKEGWEYRPEPHSVLFENYVATWRSTILANAKSKGKQLDWNLAIDCWLLPYFGEKTFHQIHAVEMQKFLAQLKRRKGKKKGEPLSRSRVNNLLIPLRAIWSDASEENHWDLPDPFRFVKKHLPEGGKNIPRASGLTTG